MQLDEILRQRAELNPQKTALVCEGQRLTYKELDEKADRLAQALIHHGLQRGDRVGLYLGNSSETVISLFAVLRAGGVFVVISQTVKPEKLVFMLNHCRATGLLSRVPASAPDCSLAVKEQVSSLKFLVSAGKRGALQHHQAMDGCLSFEQLLSDFPSIPPDPVGIDLDLACLIYTSGSTGLPKAVMCDHGSMLFAIDSINQYLKHSEADVVLSVLPLAFSYGLYQLLTVFRAGGTLVLESSFAYPALTVQKIIDEQVTGVPAVPTMCSILAQMDLEKSDFSKLRYMTNAAAALAPSVLLELRRKLPHVEFFSMHGLTEVVRTVFLNPAAVEKLPCSVGKAIPGTEVWLEDPEGNRLALGETGELIVRGRHVMRGYWNDVKGTEERFRPGILPGERVCCSGDLFRTDAAGNFYFVSRKDDIIKCRGEKVAPREIENILWAIEGVVEAAVVGVPDPVLGQAIKAIIVSKDNQLTIAQVLSHCRAHLEEHMVPRYVEFLPELPKTASGKILKSDLIAKCAE